MEMPQGIVLYNVAEKCGYAFVTESTLFVWFLQVRWDETSSVPRPERVSPWNIEVALTPPALNPLPVSRSKRPRANMMSSSTESSVLAREG